MEGILIYCINLSLQKLLELTRKRNQAILMDKEKSILHIKTKLFYYKFGLYI